MTLDRRTQALLDLVEADRASRCAAIAEQARAQAAVLLAQARAEARQRVREAFAEERQRAQARLAAARAELQTRRRLHEQRHAAAWLALGWQRLPAALRERWGDGDSRRCWVDAAVERARQVLAPGRWRIRHADGWPDGERQALATRLQQQLGAAPELALEPSIDAGLRIAADGNVVDASLAGLTTDRDEIGAQLLAELGAPS